jgi:hypothetical protein
VLLRLEMSVRAPLHVNTATAVQLSASPILMGMHGRSGLSRLVCGSVAEAVLRAAGVPVRRVPIRSASERLAWPVACESWAEGAQ